MECDWRIVVLPYGNVLVGEWQDHGSTVHLFNASVIRRWGTNAGLGQIAKSGPTGTTRLDPCNGMVRFHRSALIFSIDTDRNLWL